MSPAESSPTVDSVQDIHTEQPVPVLEPIAICGMACRLPGDVDSPSSLWDMLLAKRTGQTATVPPSRFNIDAHLHLNPDRPGSINVPGGYFLSGFPDDFDPAFFGITPAEARWLDPQQRRMLEVSYECLVSAGLTLDAVAGSNTAVFVGTFTADYQQMTVAEPDFRHSYAATGVDQGIISNRIGNVFNLNGPSFTINTACSSSIYALHNACNALRARDCDAAIVGGVNLILTIDQHMNTAKLGVLSPTSTCHTFDAAADGYGRAEGAGALYIKRLADAVRDGDPVRAVIRATAVNTNGRVAGVGITHPSAAGQERVVRAAYAKAGLDPADTLYAELHGTGTTIGDPVEVRAISRALNDKRSPNRPLLIGALKPNIGHSEAASGIFAVIKAAMMTETAVIPGVALFQNLNPQIRDAEWNVRVHADTAPWPAASAATAVVPPPPRRVSVSSFGYGGTNGHVIVEAVDALAPSAPRHGRRRADAPYDHSTPRPLLVCLSAHDRHTLARNANAIGAVAADYFSADLAHTLNARRTAFAHRAYTVVRDGDSGDGNRACQGVVDVGHHSPAAAAFDIATMRTGVLPSKNGGRKNSSGGVGFLFTGQGAQWAGMFRAALADFPVLLATVRSLDAVLARALVPNLPTFSLAETLLANSPDSTTTTGVAARIDDPDVAQPLATAVQIAVVDLLASWGITPRVNIGHSSGEIAAAYASGLICAPEAIVAAFCRGRAVAEHSTAGTGSMLAVGLGVEDVSDWLMPATPESPLSPVSVASSVLSPLADSPFSRPATPTFVPDADALHLGPAPAVCVACENSPSSVTLSGDAAAISRLAADMSARGIFARELRTGRAYHSPHMANVSVAYDRMLADAHAALTEDDRVWRRPRATMISSVTGDVVAAVDDEEADSLLPPGYWSANLRQRVLFDTAVRTMATRKSNNNGTDNNKDREAGGASIADGLSAVVEIGPHSALSGPFKQICLAEGDRLAHVSYVPSLVRKKNDSAQLLAVAGSLFLAGCAVDLAAVNGLGEAGLEHCLVDLPQYQWNYHLDGDETKDKKRHWAEPRASAERRALKFPRHDLLGSAVAGLSTGLRAWRNIIRHRDLGWLKDHELGGAAILPAAGYLSMAVEALRQVRETAGLPFPGVRLRDVDFRSALAIPYGDDSEGIEVIVTLHEPTPPSSSPSGSLKWHRFTIESWLPTSSVDLTAGEWTLNCSGTVAVAATDATGASSRDAASPVVPGDLPQHVAARTWYDAFWRIGFRYGPAFQLLRGVRTRVGSHYAASAVGITQTSGIVEGESRYLLHPATVDACLQLGLVADHDGRHAEMPWGLVPTRIEEAVMFFPDHLPAGSNDSSGQAAETVDGQAVSWVAERSQGKRFVNHSRLFAPDGKLLLSISNWECIAYEAALPPSAAVLDDDGHDNVCVNGGGSGSGSAVPHTFGIETWKPDLLSGLVPSLEALDKLHSLNRVTDLVCHRQTVATAALVGFPSAKTVEAVFEAMPARCTLTVGFVGQAPSVETLESLRLPGLANLAQNSQSGRIVLKSLPPTAMDWASSLASTSSKTGDDGDDCRYNLVIVDFSGLTTTGLSSSASADASTLVSTMLASEGWLIGSPTEFTAAATLNGFCTFGRHLIGTCIAEPATENRNSDNITVLSPPDRCSSPIAASLLALGKTVQQRSLASFCPTGRDTAIFIDDSDGTVFSSINQSSFSGLKAALSSGLPIVWLSRGVSETTAEPAAGMAQGFLRVLRSEQASARAVLLDADAGESNELIAMAVVSGLDHADTRDSGKDCEYWLSKGALNVPRIYPREEMNRAWAGGALANHDVFGVKTSSLSKGVALAGSMVRGELIFTEEEGKEVAERLAGGQVEIQIEASELAVRQAVVTTQSCYPVPPAIVAGTVTRADSCACSSPVGKRAVAFSQDGQLHTLVASSAYVVVEDDEHPHGVSCDTLVATLAILQPLMHAYVAGGKIGRGSRVLALPGADRAKTALIILLGRSLGWNLALAVSSEEERRELCCSVGSYGVKMLPSEVDVLVDFITTPSGLSGLSGLSGSPSVIVIAHDFSALGQEVWRNMPAASRFLLLMVSNDPSSMLSSHAPSGVPFMRGASFVPVSSQTLHDNPQAAIEILRESLNMIKTNPSLLDCDEVLTKIVDCEDVVSSKEEQDIVVRYSYGQSKVKIRPKPPSVSLSPNATYLLIGCLGGIGRSLSRWMMERGARHFAFVSRSGADKPEAGRVLAAIKSADPGASTRVFRADAADAASMHNIVAELKADKSRPIRGVVHAPMVLADGMLDNMTFDAFQRCVTPKAGGARALDAALEAEGVSADLDFLVYTSSISAVLGNMGQANYGAANSYLDSLAAKRRAQGKAATSLALPMVLGVGVVAEDGGTIESSLRRKGLYGVDEVGMLRGFEVAMAFSRPTPSSTTYPDRGQILMGLDPRLMARAATATNFDKAGFYWINDCRLQHVRADMEAVTAVLAAQSSGGAAASSSSAGESFATTVASALASGGPDAAIDAVVTHIIRRMSGILMIPVENFEADGPSLASYGLDSMIGAEMRTWLFREFGLDYPFQELLAASLTFRKLATVAAGKMGVAIE